MADIPTTTVPQSAEQLVAQRMFMVRLAAAVEQLRPGTLDQLGAPFDVRTPDGRSIADVPGDPALPGVIEAGQAYSRAINGQLAQLAAEARKLNSGG